MGTLGRTCLLLVLFACASCEKVPLTDIQAGFALADAAWFEEEKTLFIFYRANAQQGLGPESQIEVSYRTDDVELPWTPLSQLSTVHTHVPVDCGITARCGSTSLHVERVPRQVGVRLRYHRDGVLALTPPTKLNIVGTGPPHRSRSLVVYGVFDEKNTHVQWRARHQFPTLRNHEVQELGLRRTFRIADPRHGDIARPPDDNPYGYASASACPDALTPLGWAPLETSTRAMFGDDELPLSASTSSGVCARATVTDAKGTFDAVALARKNPEVRPAFPALRSPIRANTAIGFLLRPCRRTISNPHLSMQMQRLLIAGAPEICIDDWRDTGFAAELSARFRARIDEVRTQGRDMVLTLALHHDEPSGELANVIERALEQTLPFERDKSSPRVSGAFVFDSFSHTLGRAPLKSLVLWCPANLAVDDLDQVPDQSQHSCPVLPDRSDLQVGPFRINSLPILPTRAQYLTFVSKYSEAQAGQMRELRFLAPERTPISENIQIGEFGVITFFNNEILTAAPGDVFSHCMSDNPRASYVVFRTPLSPEPASLETLPELHEATPQPVYELGLRWDFPFVTRLRYEVFIAGAVSAFSLTVPFGIPTTSNEAYGPEMWLEDEFPLDDTLLQCTRFCEHPTFDSDGVYNVTRRFRESYRNQCYRPRYPDPADGGFPHDP
ncbi:hypothetical protein JQX13_37030 [Archangium violaceum]|uniref:hypothetical protein n=1 Tax=Archangium violaceum TaxID=83451 RepID=UPI00193C740D|nr:hypothetical protein [Archangium violaceum]QRK05712.1 hypothetical protein JQX13_37030 [Archangium violaceum]